MIEDMKDVRKGREVTVIDEGLTAGSSPPYQ
jgi:hypothetical protein